MSTKKCSGTMSNGNASRLARFRRGRHPKRDEKISGPWPWCQSLEVLHEAGSFMVPPELAVGRDELPVPVKPRAAPVQLGFDDPDGCGGDPDEEVATNLVEAPFDEPPGMPGDGELGSADCWDQPPDGPQPDWGESDPGLAGPPP